MIHPLLRLIAHHLPLLQYLVYFLPTLNSHRDPYQHLKSYLVWLLLFFNYCNNPIRLCHSLKPGITITTLQPTELLPSQRYLYNKVDYTYSTKILIVESELCTLGTEEYLYTVLLCMKPDALTTSPHTYSPRFH